MQTDRLVLSSPFSSIFLYTSPLSTIEFHGYRELEPPLPQILTPFGSAHAPVYISACSVFPIPYGLDEIRKNYERF
jgi:hypothetical protein